VQTENNAGSNASKPEKLLDLLRRPGGISEPLSSVADYVGYVRGITERWQSEDWRQRGRDDACVLNTARIVGQVWFRGHCTCDLSLQPGLYRQSVWMPLLREVPDGGSGTDEADRDELLFDDLFDLEHEMRIDFTSYGHLLNESNQAKSHIDWYFLMQHHLVPTRLLDWSTNALGALYFAVEEYGKRLAAGSPDASPTPEGQSGGQNYVAVWAVDAYWLADHLSDEWSAPLLAYTEDAAKYVPPLERLVERFNDARALVPKYPMPIEPPAMHPRVAAQEGRFIIFGRAKEMLHQKIRLEKGDNCEEEDSRVKQIRFAVSDPDAVLRELAQLGVSRRTLFPDLAGLAEFVRWKHLHQIRT
jgi:hypothetical protein